MELELSEDALKTCVILCKERTACLWQLHALEKTFFIVCCLLFPGSIVIILLCGQTLTMGLPHSQFCDVSTAKTHLC